MSCVAFLCTDPRGKFDIAERVRLAGLDSDRVMLTEFYASRELRDWSEMAHVLKGVACDTVIIDNTTDMADNVDRQAETKLITDGLRLWADRGLAPAGVRTVQSRQVRRSPMRAGCPPRQEPVGR